jgi:predicted dienelactone hydrolase
MLRFLAYASLGIFGVILLLFGFVFVASTKERVAPAQLAGFHETTLPVLHRDLPLSVFVWYPSDAAQLPNLINQNALFYGFYAMRDAPAREMPAPVVVLSHGSGGNAPGLGWIATQLATNGMIVLATNHPGTTSRDSLPSETVKIWERPADLTALLDFAEDGLPLGMRADMSRVAAMGFSLGGHSALSLAGITVSKAQFIAYCETYPDKIDCGWMNAAGLDFQTIDQTRYEQSNKDSRLSAVVSVDPALPLAVRTDGLDALEVETLILQLGATDTIPEGLSWDAVAQRTPLIRLEAIKNTYHFAFLAECSLMGKVVIGLAGDDNICADHGTRPRQMVHAEIAPMILKFLTTAFER